MRHVHILRERVDGDFCPVCPAMPDPAMKGEPGKLTLRRTGGSRCGCRCDEAVPFAAPGRFRRLDHPIAPPIRRIVWQIIVVENGNSHGPLLVQVFAADSAVRVNIAVDDLHGFIGQVRRFASRRGEPVAPGRSTQRLPIGVAGEIRTRSFGRAIGRRNSAGHFSASIASWPQFGHRSAPRCGKLSCNASLPVVSAAAPGMSTGMPNGK